MKFSFAASCLCLASLAWAQQPTGVPENATQKVSDHVYAIIGFPNVVIVTGTSATLVVDSGMGPSNGAVIVKEVEKLAKGKPIYLMTTHFHPEHATGDQAFPAGTTLIRSATQQKEMDEHGLEFIERFKGFNATYRDQLKDVKLRKPDVIYDKEKTLDLGGGVKARLFWGGISAHTKGDEFAFIEPDKALISGDIVQNKLVPNLPTGDSSFNGWLELLDKLAPLKPRYVLPDHGTLGDGSLIAQQKAFMVDLRDSALALKKQGVPADEAGKKLQADFQKKYSDWNTSFNNIANITKTIYGEAK